MKIGLIGAGNIARVIADNAKNGSGGAGGYEVFCVFDIDKRIAEDFSKKYKCSMLKPAEFPELDLVVEAASQEAVRQCAEMFLGRGQSLMVMSVGAFADVGLFEKLKRLAEKNNAKLVLPSGAVAGLDGIKSASVGKIYEVTLTSTKPPEGFGVDVKKRTLLFEGPASEAVKKYPKNVNIAGTLSLVGIGFDKTKVRIVADPAVKVNRHEVEVRGEFGEMRVELNHVPSPQNPKTSYLAAMSAVSAIRRFKESVVIG